MHHLTNFALTHGARWTIRALSNGVELVWWCHDESTTARTKNLELPLQKQSNCVLREGREVSTGSVSLGKRGAITVKSSHERTTSDFEVGNTAVLVHRTVVSPLL